MVDIGKKTMASVESRPSEDLSVCSGAKARAVHTILMVCDFFYPNFGGVEQHMFQLSQFLLRRGHKVVVMTHAYGERSGVRYLTNGLKVYYAPVQSFFKTNTWPTLYGNFPMLRWAASPPNLHVYWYMKI